MPLQYSKLGDYEIVRLIGQGGMGAVYEGLNPLIGRSVAIKVLLPEYANLDEVVRRFFNEAKAVNAIKHPGVVQVSDVGTASDGSLFLVMELLEGPTLSQRLQQGGGRLSEEDTLTICWQLAGVLAAAHAKNIVHRDRSHLSMFRRRSSEKTSQRRRWNDEYARQQRRAYILSTGGGW